MPSIAETFKRKSRVIRAKLKEKLDNRLIQGRRMSAKFATRQNLQMEREKSASIANSKFARDAVFKSLYLDRNR